MADLRLDPTELRPLVQLVLSELVNELEESRDILNGKLALTEAEASALLDLNSWQLRDLRLAGKIGHTRIVGNRVRYLPRDLRAYLQEHHQPGNG